MTEVETKIRVELWVRVYTDCLNRNIGWFEAKEEADTAVACFDKRDDKK